MVSVDLSWLELLSICKFYSLYFKVELVRHVFIIIHGNQIVYFELSNTQRFRVLFPKSSRKSAYQNAWKERRHFTPVPTH